MSGKFGALLILVAAVMALSGCGTGRSGSIPEAPTEKPAAGEESALPAETVQPEEKPAAEEEQLAMRLMIGDTPVAVQWEENESVEALRRLTEQQPLSVPLSMYGGFEQVGPLGQSLPRNDVQTTAGSGDIVLYSGNQIVLLYGSNSWAYTRLGHITDQDESAMGALLGNGDVSITIFTEADRSEP